MKTEIAKLLADTADELGIVLTARHDYSGRSMYGKETSGVEYDEDRYLIQTVAEAARKLAAGGKADAADAADDFVAAMGRVKFDNMGRGMICY